MGFLDTLRKVLAGSTPQASTKLLPMSKFLQEDAVVLFSAGPSRQQVLGSLLGKLDLPDASLALKAILAREEAGSTVIAPGIALPHARLPHLPQLTAALGICPEGVMDPGSNTGPVRLYLVFLGPAEDMRQHLAFLASAAAVLQTPGLVEKLCALKTPKDILQKLRQVEKSL